MNLLNYSLIIAIIAGQLFKFTPFDKTGATILDLTVFFLVVLGIFKLKFRLKNPSKIIKIASVFVLVLILSLLLSPLNLSNFEYLSSLAYILRFSLYLLFGWIIYSKAFQIHSTKVLILSGIGLAISGLIQLILLPDLYFLTLDSWDPHYFRVVSTFLDPNFTGAFLVLTLLLLLNYELSGKTKVSFFIVVFIALLATFSRGAYLMFGVSFLTLSLINKSLKIFSMTTLLSLILLFSFVLYSQNIAEPRNIDRQQSASFRIESWADGFEIFKRNPILGIGFNSYKYALEDFNLAPTKITKSRGGTTNDSSLLFVLATTGLIGISIYLGLITSILVYAYKLNGAIFAGILGLIIHSFFANSLFYPFFLIWIILALDSFGKNTKEG